MTTLLAIFRSKITKWGVIIAAVAGSIGAFTLKYQTLKKDREATASRLAESYLAYTHMAQQNTVLQQTIAKLKKQIYTITVQHPDGTIVTTTSEFIDSTTTTSSTSSVSSTPGFRPESKTERYPFMTYAMVNNQGWSVGPGWEVGKFSLPLLPYTHIGLGASVGQTYSGKLLVGGIISLQWEKK